jgi:hypothetical protein
MLEEVSLPSFWAGTTTAEIRSEIGYAYDVLY